MNSAISVTYSYFAVYLTNEFRGSYPHNTTTALVQKHVKAWCLSQQLYSLNEIKYDHENNYQKMLSNQTENTDLNV